MTTSERIAILARAAKFLSASDGICDSEYAGDCTLIALRIAEGGPEEASILKTGFILRRLETIRARQMVQRAFAA